MKLVQLIANKALPKHVDGDRAGASDSIQTVTPAAVSMEEIVQAYLVNFQKRFYSYLDRSDMDTRWDEVWVAEVALLEANHAEALSAATSDRTKRYLTRRKERILDFVWCMCRDSPRHECREMRESIEAFARKEERILGLYVVSYIECIFPSSKAL